MNEAADQTRLVTLDFAVCRKEEGTKEQQDRVWSWQPCEVKLTRRMFPMPLQVGTTHVPVSQVYSTQALINVLRVRERLFITLPLLTWR